MPAGDRAAAADALAHYWARPLADVVSGLDSHLDGLTSTEAAARLRVFGRNTLRAPRIRPWVRLLLSRFASPLVLILTVAALVSLVLHEWIDAGIVLGIVLLTALIGFVQEHRAAVAVETLRRRVSVTAEVLRDGRRVTVPADEVVPGDILELSAGALVPADARLIEARDCFVNQAMLTGESLPVEKRPGEAAASAGLADRGNCVFMGTSVRSGWARALAIDTGRSTVYGGIAGELMQRQGDTEFEQGLRRFGGLLMRLMLAVVIGVLAVNLLLQRPVVDTLLFAAALAVGLSPELLPAILAITLSHGARTMAREGVIVKRLNAIENLGTMDVLCTDKTGTLTRGVIELDATLDPQGQPSPEVLALALCNARLQTGIRNALDEAVVARGERDGTCADAPVKLDEIPYDFQRRRLSVVVRDGTGPAATMITKGAVENVLAICTTLRMGPQEHVLDAPARAEAMQRFIDWSTRGFRVLAVATRAVAATDHHAPSDEAGLCLRGFLLFLDPPEPQAAKTLSALRRQGVEVKIITGDNRFVARHVADGIGMDVRGVLSGNELQALDDADLAQRALSTTLFAEVEPDQKQRIIRTLQAAGHVVGYLGDGINDAPALHAADVGISVDTAVDVAKDAADFVLLKHDLDVIRRGIDEGRHTFANTIKYVFITTSANFGNMISMALATLYLPFLPLLAKQILLNNFLSDIPAMGIAGDRVDREWARTPHRWDMRLIRRSMLTFGLTSAAFDLLTFVVLLALVGGDPALFRTGWFLESLLTELWILLVIRTYKPFYRSRPGRFLVASSAATMAVALLLPYSPLAGVFGFVPLPYPVLGAILLITTLYVLVSEISKPLFYRRLPPATVATDPSGPRSRPLRRAGAVFGVLGLLAVVSLAVHLGDIERLLALLRAIAPAWLLLAVLLQLATYASVALAWRYALRSMAASVPLHRLLPLALAKLFVDQTVPTGGISGTAFMLASLSRQRVPRPACLAALLATLAGHYAAYLLAALGGYGLLVLEHETRPWMANVFALFALVSLAVPLAVLAVRWYGRREPAWLRRIPGIAALLDDTVNAPMTLLRRPRVLLAMGGFSLAVILLDAATLWTMLHALGMPTDYQVAFPSFLLAMMITTIGPIPLGLGSFEATCVATLTLQGVPIEAALAATLLLRGLTTWLPMLPGLVLARRELRATPAHGPAPSGRGSRNG